MSGLAGTSFSHSVAKGQKLKAYSRIFLLLKIYGALLKFSGIAACSFGGGMCMPFILYQHYLDLSMHKQILLLWEEEA
jgi:hypothetical protein